MVGRQKVHNGNHLTSVTVFHSDIRGTVSCINIYIPDCICVWFVINMYRFWYHKHAKLMAPATAHRETDSTSMSQQPYLLLVCSALSIQLLLSICFFFGAKQPKKEEVVPAIWQK